MKIEFTQEKLANGLGVVERGVGKDVNLPVLTNVYIGAKNGRIKLASTNLEVGLTCFVVGKVIEEGEITVPARLLGDYINTLKGGRVLINEVDSKLEIRGEGGKAQINVLSAGEFPLIPKIKGDAVGVVRMSELKRALSQVIFAAANDESRPEIAGVYWEIKGDKEELIIAATDSYRLAENKINLSKDTEARGLKFIVPSRTMQELARIIPQENGEVRIFFEGGQVEFRFNEQLTGGEVCLVSRLIEGQYPEYTRIIPNDFETEIELKLNDFSSALRTTSLFAKNDTNDIRLKVLKDGVEIYSESGQMGSGRAKIGGRVKGREMEVVFNYRFFLDCLASIKSEKIKLKLSSKDGPGAIKAVGEDGYTYVVMPIRQ